FNALIDCDGVADEMPELSDGDDGGDDEEQWMEEGDTEQVNVPCLFCDRLLSSVSATLQHCSTEHQVNVVDLIRKYNLDDYGYIKMINFIRLTVSTACCQVLPLPWDGEDFLRPVLQDDPLLQTDLEELCGEDGFDPSVHSPGTHDALLQRAQAAEERARRSEEALARAMEDLHKLKLLAQGLVLNTETSKSSNLGAVAELREDEDEAYFSSYGHYGIHEEMLKDKVRTESYRDFIYHNPDVFKDKVSWLKTCKQTYLHKGLGSVFDMQAVTSDQLELSYEAMPISSLSALSVSPAQEVGSIHQSSCPSVLLSVTVSATQGYFLLFESMLDSVLYARDLYLSDSGSVYPDLCNISLAALGDRERHQDRIAFWEDVYGFDMACMKTAVVAEAVVEVVKADTLISEPTVIQTFDCNRVCLSELEFTSDFSLKITNTTECTAIVGYFDIFFDKGCSTKVMFSTGPQVTKTHWKQTVFLLEWPISVHAGEELQGKITVRKNKKDPRSLLVTFDLRDRKLTYSLQ
uniref:type I protein arginine methyltransferase n=1 Tax=Tetraodon nigroviridis TaxID=99883 RepID=H3CW52_TETNG